MWSFVRPFLLCTLSIQLTACATAERVLPDKDSLPLVYRVDIQQGNVITQEMLAQLQPGMDKTKVRHIMGTPPLIDTFHSNEWHYIYTFQEGNDTRQMRRVTLHFLDERLTRVEGNVKAAPGPMVVERKPAVEAVVPEAEKRVFDRMRETVGLGGESRADAAAKRMEEVEAERLEQEQREAEERAAALRQAAPELEDATAEEAESFTEDGLPSAPTEDPVADTETTPLGDDEASVENKATAEELAVEQAATADQGADTTPRAEERQPGFFRRMLRGFGLGDESDRDRALKVPEQDL